MVRLTDSGASAVDSRPATDTSIADHRSTSSAHESSDLILGQREAQDVLEVSAHALVVLSIEQQLAPGDTGSVDAVLMIDVKALFRSLEHRPVDDKVALASQTPNGDEVDLNIGTAVKGYHIEHRASL